MGGCEQCACMVSAYGWIGVGVHVYVWDVGGCWHCIHKYVAVRVLNVWHIGVLN